MSFPAAVRCFMAVKVSGGWCHISAQGMSPPWLLPPAHLHVTALLSPHHAQTPSSAERLPFSGHPPHSWMLPCCFDIAVTPTSQCCALTNTSDTA